MTLRTCGCPEDHCFYPRNTNPVLRWRRFMLHRVVTRIYMMPDHAGYRVVLLNIVSLIVQLKESRFAPLVFERLRACPSI